MPWNPEKRDSLPLEARKALINSGLGVEKGFKENGAFRWRV